MKLILIRHGEAEDPREFARRCEDDGLRPLTRRGRRRAKKAGRGLAKLLQKVDLLASSPLTRAWQTAKLISAGFEKLKPIETRELAPRRKPAAVLKWLQGHDRKGTLILVGHEPDIGILATWLMTGLDESALKFGKGSACLIRFDDAIAAGHGRLEWHLSPRQLRHLA